MDGMRNDPVHFEGVTVRIETPKALLCKIGTDEVWIPKALIDDDSEVYKKGTEGRLIIPVWLAEEKELV